MFPIWRHGHVPIIFLLITAASIWFPDFFPGHFPPRNILPVHLPDWRAGNLRAFWAFEKSRHLMIENSSPRAFWSVYFYFVCYVILNLYIYISIYCNILYVCVMVSKPSRGGFFLGFWVGWRSGRGTTRRHCEPTLGTNRHAVDRLELVDNSHNVLSWLVQGPPTQQ